MNKHTDNNPILVLEETLFILEECLQGDNSLLLDSTVVSHHIQVLKKYYSPGFDFDYSETGSYFFAALNSINRVYLGPDAIYFFKFCDKFSKSLDYLIRISRLSINYRSYKNSIIDHMLALAKLWNLHHAMDMRILLLRVLSLMRAEVLEIDID